MGLTAAPLPLTPEQFHKSWREGKRTMQEIDPALSKWYYSKKKFQAFGAIAVGIGIAFIIIFAILILGTSTR